jgi:hypothetical protein
MNKDKKKSTISIGRLSAFALLVAALLAGTAYVSTTRVSANHPVYVEGNCDSPVPGTTLVTIAGTCGDFDGDGRIGTAEDTDGADRIFGTLRAALGPGTGAAAGTGANWNGSIIIVSSGRFAEQLFIGQSGFIPGEGTGNPGNVTIEAAPGVNADIDAVLQGDPAGGNTTRQNSYGIFVLYPPGFDRIVTLRNLTIRNFSEGIASALSSKIHIDRCRIDGNLSAGVHIIDNVQLTITNSTFTGNGRRIGGPSATPNPGNGLTVDGGNAQARISDSTFSHNFGAGIAAAGPAANVVLFKVGTYFNGTNILGAVTTAPNPNSAQ